MKGQMKERKDRWIDERTEGRINENHMHGEIDPSRPIPTQPRRKNKETGISSTSLALVWTDRAKYRTWFAP